MPMALILGLHRGRLDHLPHLTLTLRIPHQHTQQRAHVQPIAFGPPPPAVDLNSGGIQTIVGDALCLQKPMAPEALPTRLITTYPPRRLPQAPTTCGPGA